MKTNQATLLKKILTAALLLFIISSASRAQTNVSGGIYANTTWTLAGSPYIVVDTVVVFPGVTLTIDPGVEVRFANNKRLEIRQATLNAIGTITDSITFTSNSASPVPGIWSAIFLNQPADTSIISYCNVRYANFGINVAVNGNVVIKNSNFNFNNSGVYYNINTGVHVFIDSSNFRNNTNGVYTFPSDGFLYVNGCTIVNNQNGIYLGTYSNIANSIIDSNSVVGVYHYSYRDTVINCEIKYNGIGIHDLSSGPFTGLTTRNIIENNNIGIKLEGTHSIIYCNKICNNATYDLQYTVAFGGNTDMANNYWCTPDSISTTARIYDGYDNINLGLINFMPMDTIGCYLTGCNLIVTTYVINATCDTCHNGSAAAYVTNGFPPYTYTWLTSPIQTTQTAVGLASGTYTVCVTDANGCTACISNVFVDSTNCTGFSVIAVATNATCATCTDGSATANVIGGSPPYAYTWYTSPIQTTQIATGLSQGVYVVCAGDGNGCMDCDTIIVGIGNCSAQFNLYPDTIPQFYYAVNMASGVPPLSFDWNWGDSSPHDTVPYPSHTYAAPGFYTICLSITDSVGCTDSLCVSYYLTRAASSMIYVNVVASLPTGIDNAPGDDSFFSVFPNPSFDFVTVSFSETVDETMQIKIYSALGKTVQSLAVTEPKNLIDVSKLSSGIYLIEIVSTTKAGWQKFIKQ